MHVETTYLLCSRTSFLSFYSMKLKILEVNMSRKKDANKYWIYGEDAALAAQFTAYLATVLKNRRLTYIRHLKKIQKVECSYEYAAETIEHVDSIREESLESAVEAKLMWEAIKPYLHKLSPKECEVMICLYIDRLSIADTATKLKIKPDTVSTHKHNAINKIRKAMGEH
jgi:RNA polymerase sigma factor (sigma-70 family)